MHFQRLSEERLQRLQATETAAADANNRAAAAVATAGDLQRQLSGTIRQRDDFSRLVSERYACSGHSDAPTPASNKGRQHLSFVTINSSGWKCNHYRTVPVGLVRWTQKHVDDTASATAVHDIKGLACDPLDCIVYDYQMGTSCNAERRRQRQPKPMQ